MQTLHRQCQFYFKTIFCRTSFHFRSINVTCETHGSCRELERTEPTKFQIVGMFVALNQIKMFYEKNHKPCMKMMRIVIVQIVNQIIVQNMRFPAKNIEKPNGL